MFIQKIHTLFALLEGKNLATTRPPEEIDAALEMVLQDLFNKYLDHYVKTKKIETYLLPFKKIGEITLNNSGSGDLPGDYALYEQVWLTDRTTKVTMIPNDFWHSRRNRKLGAPSATTPIAKLEVLGASVPSITVYPVPADKKVSMDYFKKIATPRYGYTISGTRYVFDESTSVDVEFPQGLYPDIMNRLLQSFGITLREGQLFEMMERAKMTEQAK
jgi:hypothetical protein